MNQENFNKQLSKVNKKGGYVHIEFGRQLENYKKFGDLHITKETTAVVRLGIKAHKIMDPQYQAKLANNGGGMADLPWGNWVGKDHLLIENKGKLYLRCAISRSPKHISKVKYYINGVEVPFSQVEQYLTAKEKIKSSEPVFNINIENIKKLGC